MDAQLLRAKGGRQLTQDISKPNLELAKKERPKK